MPTDMMDVRPYSVLSAGYDAVMEHVDYPGWVDHIDGILSYHGQKPSRILELGCGTGTFAALVAERIGERSSTNLHSPSAPDFGNRPEGVIQSAFRSVSSYLATDRSQEMLNEAAYKCAGLDSIVELSICDFNKILPHGPFDAILLLYDGLNYLLAENEVTSLFGRVAERLTPDGLFIFDQSTPANSTNNEDYFEDDGSILLLPSDAVASRFDYHRDSRYDAESRHHTTTFELCTGSDVFREHHVQRAYEREEISGMLAPGPLEAVGSYDDFSLEPSTIESERIHWVCRKAR